ncbi:hypothetical protein ACFL3V_02150 [Nanoarchaeota archaeon]
MNGKILIGIFLTIIIMLLAGCKAPTCYPPNEIIDNKCCVDDDSNDVCDYEEGKATEKESDVTETVEEAEDQEEVVEADLDEEEPEIQEIDIPEPAPIRMGIQLGKQKMKLGEAREYLQLHEISAYRTSRDKGIMDYMVLTVRNPSGKKLNPLVELLFEGARLEEHSTRVKKEYEIPALEPGEKYVMNKSLGIRYASINKTKKMTLTVFEKFSAPRENLGTVKKEFVPTDYMDSLEIFTYGKPE